MGTDLTVRGFYSTCYKKFEMNLFDGLVELVQYSIPYIYPEYWLLVRVTLFVFSGIFIIVLSAWNRRRYQENFEGLMKTQQRI